MIRMTKEELEEATEIILDSIMNSNLSNYTKIELLINLRHFLNPQDYKRNIAVLERDYYMRRFDRDVKNNEQYNDIGESKDENSSEEINRSRGSSRRN